LIEAAERSLDFSIGGKPPSFGLLEAPQDPCQMFGVDGLGLAVIADQMKHGARYLVLAFRRKTASRFQGFLKKLGHAQTIRALIRGGKSSIRMATPQPSPASARPARS